MKTKELMPYVEGPPLTLPADTRRRPRTIVDAISDFLGANYDKDETVRKCALSLNKTDTVFGGAVDDKVMLAHKIKVERDRANDPATKDVSVHQIRGKIETALKRHQLNRAHRLAKAEKKRLEHIGAPTADEQADNAA